MNNRFTERALQILALAQKEAANLGHGFIGTEHLLLGLVSEGEGIAAKVLASLNIELEKVRQEVEKAIGRGDSQDVRLTYTPRAKTVLKLGRWMKPCG